MYKRSRMSRGNPKDFQEPTHPLIYGTQWSEVYKEKREETHPPYHTRALYTMSG